jgi:hypothetical protein
MTEQNTTTQADDIFAQALAKRRSQAKEQEESKNNQGQNWGDYEEVETVGLVTGKEIVGRILGNPVEQRKLPTDPKIVLQSQLVKPDKKGYVKLNWPIVEKSGKYVPDPDHFLTKFYNKVNEGRWVKYSEGILKDSNGNVYPPDYLNAKQKNGEWVRTHVKTKVFEEVSTNSKIGELYPKSFYPSKRVVANWADRHDSWCVDNKHSKLITAKKAPYEITEADGTKKTIYFQDTGIPGTLYDKIFDHCSAVGTMDIDLVITKIEKDYKVFDITDYPKYVSEASAKIGVKTRLSEEEKAWTLYDLDKLYKVSSYSKIQKYLSPMIKLCDAELGTSFEKELDALVEEEKAQRAAEKAEAQVYYINESDGSYGVTSKDDIVELIESDTNIKEVEKSVYDTFVAKQTGTVEIPKEEPKSEPVEEEPKAESKRREVKTEATNNDIESLCKVNFPAWDKLTDEEKTFMKGFITKFDGTVPSYKDNTPLGCSDESCYFVGTHNVTMVPIEVNTCPVCGKYLS